MTRLLPRQPVPDLSLPTTGGGTFTLSADHGANGTMLLFYRGLHCPLCQKQLKALAALLPEFDRRGIRPVAISSDGADRAEAMAEEVAAQGLPIAYDLPLTAARDDWGLYTSTSRGKTSIGIEEPDLFIEPALLLVEPDRSLYYLSLQTMPFARPPFEDILGAIDFAIEKNYPARGHYTGDL
ncbi:peroxiredoxin-like family protein [Ovoidimarina sediminis]|uniref:peroxiredoxin-like family protein n=1 Tax=Ovoidimarina sediminis TaxID=3079856 RepID=UPI002915B9C6|nr:peroxiredoxin-like family protein [Rhodophyticola sp. MJ-SS7]MDU8941888.1 peroxiredoxin-like family protein [Rhodophyticola sp. MJ-SS7]